MTMERSQGRVRVRYLTSMGGKRERRCEICRQRRVATAQVRVQGGNRSVRGESKSQRGEWRERLDKQRRRRHKSRFTVFGLVRYYIHRMTSLLLLKISPFAEGWGVENARIVGLYRNWSAQMAHNLSVETAD